MTYEPRPCADVCIPYFQEIASIMLTEEPPPEIEWVSEPDLRNPFPPQFQFACPHQITWMCHPTKAQIQRWETQYPLQPEVFPEPFICKVVADPDSPECDYDIEPTAPGTEALEIPLALMLEHIQLEHGAPYWLAMHHLTANYPGLNNYCGSQVRIETHQNRSA